MIHQHLPSCRPGFEYQAHHLQFILFKLNICHFNSNVKRTKINKKRPELARFLKIIKNQPSTFFQTTIHRSTRTGPSTRGLRFNRVSHPVEFITSDLRKTSSNLCRLFYLTEVSTTSSKISTLASTRLQVQLVGQHRRGSQDLALPTRHPFSTSPSIATTSSMPPGRRRTS